MWIRLLLGRTLAVLACVCGAFGWAKALIGHGPMMNYTGWFTAGALLALLALFVLADQHLSSGSRQAR